MKQTVCGDYYREAAVPMALLYPAHSLYSLGTVDGFAIVFHWTT